MIRADPGRGRSGRHCSKSRRCRFRCDPFEVDRIAIAQPVASLREATG